MATKKQEDEARLREDQLMSKLINEVREQTDLRLKQEKKLGAQEEKVSSFILSLTFWSNKFSSNFLNMKSNYCETVEAQMITLPVMHVYHTMIPGQMIQATKAKIWNEITGVRSTKSSENLHYRNRSRCKVYNVNPILIEVLARHQVSPRSFFNCQLT